VVHAYGKLLSYLETDSESHLAALGSLHHANSVAGARSSEKFGVDFEMG